MNALPTILTLWGLALSAFVALMVYRAQLTRQETDQLFLTSGETLDREAEHQALVQRVNRIQPFVKGAAGAAAVLSILMVGVYVANLLPSVRF